MEPNYYPTRAIEVVDELELGADFKAWLAENWLLWGEFVSLALLVKKRGRTRWSADALCHVLRWQREIRDNSDVTFKVNNNHTSKLARLFNGCAGERFFETRRLHMGAEVL
jgi:hypothetical protein